MLVSVSPRAVNCLLRGTPYEGTPLPRQKVCKVFESETLGLDLGCHQVALVLVLNLFLRYVCQVYEDAEKVPRETQSLPQEAKAVLRTKRFRHERRGALEPKQTFQQPLNEYFQ